VPICDHRTMAKSQRKPSIAPAHGTYVVGATLGAPEEKVKGMLTGEGATS